MTIAQNNPPSSTNFWLERRTIVAYAVSLLALAEIIDLTIVSVAVPHIMGSLNANLSEVSLTMTSYIVAAAVCIPLTGLVTRKFGTKRVILASAVIFMISSILCGISSSLTEMVIFRLMQGVGGAFLPSIAQSYISRNFTQEEQPKVMTAYSLCVVMGPVLGPILGGILSESLSWRWIFYINVPICIAGFILIWKNMKQEVEENVKIDYISFAFMALGVACLEYFIDEGNSNNWLDSMQMLIVLTTAIILLIFFVWRGVLGKSVINLNVFKNTNVMLCCLCMFVFMLLLSASMAYFPTMLQQSFGYPVDTAGLITAPRGLIALVAAPIIAKLMGVVDPRKILFCGLFISALGSFMLASYAPQVSQGYIIASVIIQGIGMMAFFIPIMQIIFIGVDSSMHNDVSGIFNFFRNMASSVGTSLSATIIAHQMQVTYHDMGAQVSPYARGYQTWAQHLGNTPDAMKAVIAQATVMGQGAFVSYLDVYFVTGVIMLCTLWLPFVLKRPTRGAPIHLE